MLYKQNINPDSGSFWLLIITKLSFLVFHPGIKVNETIITAGDLQVAGLQVMFYSQSLCDTVVVRTLLNQAAQAKCVF